VYAALARPLSSLLCFLVKRFHATPPPAGPVLIAIGAVSSLYEDFATETAGALEDGSTGQSPRRPSDPD